MQFTWKRRNVTVVVNLRTKTVEAAIITFSTGVCHFIFVGQVIKPLSA